MGGCGRTQRTDRKCYFTHWKDDIATSGQSRYDNMVPITVSDQNFPKREYTYWYTSRYSALGDSGTSLWMADTNIGFNGGYANVWYQTLDSDPITLSGDNLSLQFEQRYAAETPGGEPAGYDGWDGRNVRISVDRGNIDPGLVDLCPTDNYGFLPDLGKWFSSFLMLVGRLEIYTVLIIFAPMFWKK